MHFFLSFFFSWQLAAAAPKILVQRVLARRASPSWLFVTNGIAEFWTIGECGAVQAGKDFDVNVTVIMPTGMTDQTRKIEDLLMRGCDGIAISPIDPENQADVLNKSGADNEYDHARFRCPHF